MSEITRKIAKGVAWRGAADISHQLLQVAFTAVLARLMTRADYGLVAMAFLFTRFLRSTTRVGIGAAVIQNQNVSGGQITALFMVQCTINFTISVLGCALAPLAAAFFQEPRLVPIIRVLAWLQFVDSFAFPHVILQRELRFSRYSLLELVSLVLANAVGIWLAIGGYGVWSLVAINVCQTSIYVAAIWPLAGWRPPRPVFSGIRAMLSYGINMQTSNICQYLSQNMVGIITGKYLGLETLGCLNIASNLTLVPAQKIQSIFASVLAPAFCRIQNNADELRSLFRRGLFGVAALFVPLMFGLSAISVNLVTVVYGAKWRDAGLFLTFLAVVGLCKGLQHMMHAVVMAGGLGAGTVARITLIETSVGIPLLFAGARYIGIWGLIGAHVTSALIAFTLSTRAAERAVAETGLFWNATSRSFLAAALMYLAVAGLPGALTLSTVAVLPIQVAVGAVLYATARLLTLTPQERDAVRGWPGMRLVPYLSRRPE